MGTSTTPAVNSNSSSVLPSTPEGLKLQGSTVDVTGEWANALGTRDLNAENVRKLLAALASGGAYDPTAATAEADTLYGLGQTAFGKASDVATQGGASVSALDALLQGALGKTATEKYAEFQGASPAISDEIRSVVDAAMSPYGSSMQEAADLQSAEVLKAMEKRLAAGGMLGTDSGAAKKALMQSMYLPQAQMLSDVASKRADLISSLYGNQASQLLGDVLNKPSAITAALGTTAGSYGTLGDAWNALGTGLSGLGGQYDTRGSQYFDALRGLSEQALVAPQFVTADGSGGGPIQAFLKMLGLFA